MVKRIPAGTTVSVHYIGTLDNGRIFDSTPDDEPLVFTLGCGEIFPALEAEIAGMEAGEVRNLVIPSAQAYGPRLDANILKLDRSSFPEGREIRVGQKLVIEFGGNNARTMMVTEVTEGAVTLDGNHPLAGLDLTFAVKLHGIH
ncbi:FKBP-type peptidyl-prolyl cis-trans isomerase [Geomonas sp. Red32]|uniref:FKBP-type peptidyl-prolyl cis-trans isomerase n=1 Tax=Geomonas sp. Red32 TaxID=2912856 RepID=UPI00202CDFDF|nr:FKBP-type peptidyl-prolyl cis-trans isomerase [Geomonas sp. Red32]